MHEIIIIATDACGSRVIIVDFQWRWAMDLARSKKDRKQDNSQAPPLNTRRSLVDELLKDLLEKKKTPEEVCSCGILDTIKENAHSTEKAAMEASRTAALWI